MDCDADAGVQGARSNAGMLDGARNDVTPLAKPGTEKRQIIGLGRAGGEDDFNRVIGRHSDNQVERFRGLLLDFGETPDRRRKIRRRAQTLAGVQA